jgi:hypothetical protein
MALELEWKQSEEEKLYQIEEQRAERNYQHEEAPLEEPKQLIPI